MTVSTAMRVRIICMGYRKDGRTLCGYVFVVGSIEEFEGRLEFKCPKCHKVTVFQ